MPVLARSVVVPRGQRRAAVLVSATVAAAAANMVLLRLALPHLRSQGVMEIEVPVAAADLVGARTPSVVAPASAAAVVPLVRPAPVADADPVGFSVGGRRCPPPRRDAARLTPPELDQDIEHVTVAPSNAGWVAAWNPEHVFVSTDAGAHFERVLDGPGPIGAVGFDCFGTVVVVRERQLGLRVGADERWQPVPGVELMTMGGEPEGHAAVISGGPDVIIVGRGDGDSWAPRIARSSDLGQHWRYHDVDTDWETPEVRGRQREDGTIAVSLPATDCAGDGEEVVTIRRGRVTATMGDGWWPSPGQRVDLEPWPAGLPVGSTWAGDGLARAGAHLFRVHGGRATRLPVVAESDLYVADPAGRLWTVLCHRPVIAGRTPSAVRCDRGDE